MKFGRTLVIPKAYWIFIGFIFACLPFIGQYLIHVRADAGYALTFNGSSNYISLPRSASLIGPDWTHQKTISLWLKPDHSPAPITDPLSGELIVGTDRPRLFGITRAVYNGLDRIWVWNADSGGVKKVGVEYQPGEWMHLAISHDGEFLSVYKNGILEVEISSGATALPSASQDGFFFLAGSGRTNANLYFGGTLDEIRFWRSVVAGDTIMDWFNRELASEHPDYASLAAYYRMNAGNGTVLVDDSGGMKTGSLLGSMGESNWVISDAFIGNSVTATPQPSLTITHTATLQASETPTATETVTSVPTQTSTPTETSISAASETPTATETATPMMSETSTPTETTIPSASDTPTATETAAPVPSETATPTPTGTNTETPVPSPTNTTTPTPMTTPVTTSTPTGGDPIEIAFLDTPGAAYDLAWDGNLLFVGDAWGGLRVVDISNPFFPVETGSLTTSGRLYGVTTDGEYVYGANSQNGLQIFDVSDPFSPVLIGSLDPGGFAWDLAVEGDRIYMADREGWLWIFDVSNPYQPTLLSGIATPYNTSDVVVKNGIAYAAVYYEGIHIYDVSDLSQVELLGSYPTGQAYGVKLVETSLFVANAGSIYHLDVSDPTAPTFVRSARNDGSSRSIWVDGSLLFTACWVGGVKVFDLSHPAQMIEVGDYLTPDRSRDIVLIDGKLFVADYLSGVRILIP